MTLSMYQASIPVFIRMLNNLSTCLRKAEANAETRKINPLVFTGARLAPDMHPLTRQVQIATDSVKGCAARLANVDVPSYPDTETTFAELQERIARTLTFLKSFTPAQIDGSEERIITLKIRGQDVNFKGQGYLFSFVFPNFFFHVTTTYAILRHNGVDLGKADYIGDPTAS